MLGLIQKLYASTAVEGELLPIKLINTIEERGAFLDTHEALDASKLSIYDLPIPKYTFLTITKQFHTHS